MFGYVSLAQVTTRPATAYVSAAIIGLICTVIALRAVMHRREAARSARMAEDRFRLLADMSHELRTPLNGILGVASLLSDTALDHHQRESVAQIRNSGESLLSVINNVLDLARLEAGSFSVDFEPTDVREFVDEIVQMFAPMHQANGVEIVGHCDNSVPPKVSVDRTKVRQILINLAGNATKFTTKGHVHIQGSIVSYPTGERHLRFDVSDTGPGIRVEEQKRLFAAFQQAQSGRDSTAKGSGLGLVISKRLASFMGGQMGFESEFGRGSRFWFHVPVMDAGGDAATVPSSEKHVSGKPRAFVAANSALMRVQVEQIVNEYGFPWNEVCTPAELLGRVQSEGTPVDLLVLDANPDAAPVGELVRAVRAERRGEAVPALILCNSTTDLERVQTQQIPCSIAVLKPLAQEQVGAALDLLLGVGSGLAKLAQSVANPVLAGPTESPQPNPASTDAMRILVGEDNPVNRRVLAGMIERLGHEAHVVEDGHDALYAAMSEGPFDLVLLDCSMPRMDGFEASRRIREANSTLNAIPIVAVTAHADPAVRQRCMESGMNDVVLKPISLRTLSEIIVRYGKVGATARL